MESILVYPQQQEVSDAVTDHLRRAAAGLRDERKPPQDPANVAAALLRETCTGGSALADYVGASLGEHLVETLGLTEGRLYWSEGEKLWSVFCGEKGILPPHPHAMHLYGSYTLFQEMMDAMQVHQGIAVWADDEDTLERIQTLNLLDTPDAERLRGEALVARVREIMKHRAMSITNEGDGKGRAGDLAACAIYHAADAFRVEDLNEEDRG